MSDKNLRKRRGSQARHGSDSALVSSRSTQYDEDFSREKEEELREEFVHGVVESIKTKAKEVCRCMRLSHAGMLMCMIL